MNAIKQKIQQSHLLSDQQKINLLVGIDGCSAEEIATLTDVLTRHEAEYQALLATYQTVVNKELAGILSDDGDGPAVREAVEQVRRGMGTMTS
ncbi:hypothetical protein HY949_02155 [Candidatus Gottesmanbacteria bacterium]|nr:hypothetical protein [Candidatus Gottesmanbacteria bacterium]